MDNNQVKTNTTESAGSTKADIAGDAFIQEMQKQLTRQSGAISSSNTNIEKAISGSIKSLRESNTASAQATESAFNRQIAETRRTGSFQFGGAQEEQRGFAINVGVLKKINEDTAREVKDLEQRKQEVILQGDAATAAKISELQLKSLEFKQQKEQQVFNNLLSMSNFGLSLKQEKRQERAQSFAEKQAINEIALEFGIPVNENDTMDTIVARAAPFAGEERNLRLQQIRADIANSNAQASKALQGDPGSSPFDSLTARILAEKIDTGEVDAGMLIDLTDSQRQSIMSERQSLREQNKKELQQIAANSRNSKEFLEKVNSASKVYNADDANEIALSIDSRPKEKGLFGKAADLFKSNTTQTNQKPTFNLNERLGSYQAPKLPWNL